METVLAFLADRGAATVPHPGGTLLAHLRRVHDVLSAWGSPPAVCLAGLAHATYGTDGFDRSLASLAERPLVAGLLGAEPERLVYTYAALDRRASYPTIDRTIRDRFTGLTATPDRATTSALVEITVANELDVVVHSERMRVEYGPSLRRLFDRWTPLLSEPARTAVAATLGPADPPARRGAP